MKLPHLKHCLRIQEPALSESLLLVAAELRHPKRPEPVEDLNDHGRKRDYFEVSLDCPYRYNVRHNDMEPYALAYGMARLQTTCSDAAKSRSAAGLHQPGSSCWHKVSYD